MYIKSRTVLLKIFVDIIKNNFYLFLKNFELVNNFFFINIRRKNVKIILT